MSQIIEEHYKGYFVTGSDAARYVYVDTHGHFSAKSYSTLEECESAIDEVTSGRELTFRGFDTYTDAWIFFKFLIKYDFEVGGISHDTEHGLWKVSFYG